MNRNNDYANSHPRRRYMVLLMGLLSVVAAVVLVFVFLARQNGRLRFRDSEETTSFLLVSKPEYASAEPIMFDFVNDHAVEYDDGRAWIGIWPESKSPGTYPQFETDSVMWMYACGDLRCRFALRQGTVVFFSDSDHGTNYRANKWPLCDGRWRAALLTGSNQVIVESQPFVVSGGDCFGLCRNPRSEVSSSGRFRHQAPEENSALSRIAFASNFYPSRQTGPVLWNHMRSVFRPDLFVWLGNTIMENESVDNPNQEDGGVSLAYDLELKRSNYNRNKEDQYYIKYGPLADPPIPVTGTWDAYDSSFANGGGVMYDCFREAQNEFMYFLDVPNHDVRHPTRGRKKQQEGVYTSHIFTTPDQNSTGVHLILLDVRTFRSPIYQDYGPCENDASTILGAKQWEWLEEQLQISSEIKVIASGTQVLSPTNQFNIDPKAYCSYNPKDDGKAFLEAVADLGESEEFDAVPLESWGQIPQERAKLLRMAEKTVRDGHTKSVVFLSGNLEWGELLVKKMPKTVEEGEEVLFYEVTTSGIDANMDAESYNANRLRVRSADSHGDGVYQYECQIPFTFDDIVYEDCTMVSSSPDDMPERPWCSIEVDDDGVHVSGQWGYCLPVEEELVDESHMEFSDENGCSGSPFLICSAQANYGGLEVDWKKRTITLSVFTPHSPNPTAASVKIDF